MSKKHRIFIAVYPTRIEIDRQNLDEEDADLVVCNINTLATWKVAPDPESYCPIEHLVKASSYHREKYGTIPIPRKKEYWC